MGSLSWPAYGFIGALVLLTVVSFTLTSTGMLLPKSSTTDSVSLRDVSARRTHYVSHYAFGK